MNFKIEECRYITNNLGLGNNPRLLRLSPSQFEEGAKFAQEQKINAFRIGREDRDSPAFVDLDFSWLEKVPDTIYLEIMLHPTVRSNIEPIYHLNNLQALTYFGYDKMPLNHHKLRTLKSLYTHYDISQLDGDSSFSLLDNLEWLDLRQIKKQRDCNFLGELPSVKELELTWSKSIECLDGLERLTNLENLTICRCSMLKDISALLQCDHLRRAYIESSRQLDIDTPTKLKAKGINLLGPPNSAISKIK